MIHIGNSLGKTVALDGRIANRASKTRIYLEIKLTTTIPAAIEVINKRQYQVTLENSHFFSNALHLFFNRETPVHLQQTTRPKYAFNEYQFQNSNLCLSAANQLGEKHLLSESNEKTKKNAKKVNRDLNSQSLPPPVMR